MLMIAFYVAIVLFFISKPESVKRGLGIACIVVCGIAAVGVLVSLICGTYFYGIIYELFFAADNMNPLSLLYSWCGDYSFSLHNFNPHNFNQRSLMMFIAAVVEIALAYFTMTYALCFSKDENGKSKVSVKNVFASESRHDDEIPIESVATVINAKYGDNAENSENDTITRSEKMEYRYRVEEVSAGLCTGTLRGAAIETRINSLAKQGWKFEQCETIVGRCCLFFARYKAVIVFSRAVA